jgi:hypothetical protein
VLACTTVEELEDRFFIVYYEFDLQSSKNNFRTNPKIMTKREFECSEMDFNSVYHFECSFMSAECDKVAAVFFCNNDESYRIYLVDMQAEPRHFFKPYEGHAMSPNLLYTIVQTDSHWKVRDILLDKCF